MTSIRRAPRTYVDPLAMSGGPGNAPTLGVTGAQPRPRSMYARLGQSLRNFQTQQLADPYSLPAQQRRLVDFATDENRRADEADQGFDAGQNSFADEIRRLYDYDPETAGLGYDDYSPDADFAGYDPNVSGDRIAGLRSRTGGFRANDLEDYDGGAGLDDYEASESLRLLRNGGGQGGSAAAGFAPGEFDAGAAVNEYARGAWGNTQADIKRQLADLRQDAAGGRLDTGFFDEDQGDVITRLTDAFGNNVAQQAVNAAGITSQSRTAASGQRLQALLGQDTHARAGADRSVDLARTADTGRLDARRLASANRLSRATELGRIGLGAAESADAFDMDRERSLADLFAGNSDRDLRARTTVNDSRQRANESRNSWMLDRARATDDTRAGNIRAGVGARNSNQSLLLTRAEGRRDRAADLLAGNTDRSQANENVSADRRERRRNRPWQLAGTLVGGVLGRV